MSLKRCNKKSKKTRPKNRKVSNNPMKRLFSYMPGMKMQWFDADPLTGDMINPKSVKVTHKSPALSSIARGIWKDHAVRIRSKTCWHWRITTVCTYRWEKRDQIETRIIDQSAVLEDLAEDMEKAIRDSRKHGDQSVYAGTVITIELVGNPKPVNVDLDAEISKYINTPDHEVRNAS